MKDFIIREPNKKISTMVSKSALEDIINSLAKVISNIKIVTNKTLISILNNSRDFIIYLEIKISEKENLANKIKEVKNKIETHCLYLFDYKPQNIVISYTGTIE